MKKIAKISSSIVILALLLGLFVNLPNWNQSNIITLPFPNSESQLTVKYDIWSDGAIWHISGDTDLAAASTDPTYGGGGYGNSTHPYIIENVTYNVYTQNAHGITIRDTSKHFILRNCYMYAPKRWNDGPNPYGGFLFLNVTNGLVNSCKVTGYPLFTATHPTLFAFWAEQCFNLTFDNCEVSNIDYLSRFCPVYLGFAIYTGNNNITIKNCDIQCSQGMELYCSSNLTIQGNNIGGPSGLPIEQDMAEIKNGIIVTKTNNSLIEDNDFDYFGNTNDYTCGISLGTTENNIIVNNYIPQPYEGRQIIEYTSGVDNSFIKLESPTDNTDYVGPEAPSPGYYTNSEGFERLGDMTYPWGEPYTSESIWKHYIGANSTLAIIPNKTDAGGNDHKKVLECYNWEGISYYVDKRLDNPLSIPLSGTYEFWFAKEDSGSGTVAFQFYHEIPEVTLENTSEIMLEGGLFKYRDNVTLVNTGIPVAEDKWYRLSIDFCADSSSYEGLPSNHCQFRIHDSDGHRLLYRSPAIEFLNESIDHFRVTTQTSGSSNLTVFIDAPGFSWDPSYEVGDNADEGILLNFTYQQDGVWDYSLAYSVDGQPEISDPIHFEWLAAGKKVIPLPDSDGTHSIQLKCNATVYYTMFNYAPSTYLSKTKSFTISYYNTYLDIIEHTENGEVFPPGLLGLTTAEDLMVNMTYKTRLGTAPDTMDTWTNVSWYYKINNNPWNGPYNLGYWYGLKNVSFVISNTSYNAFDHIYYYLAFEQYDNDSKYLDSYYWTGDSHQQGAFQYDEWEAQSTAFHKKVAPIAYDLSLNYSVFFHSQVETTLPHVGGYNDTAYPMLGITNGEIQVDFHNLTSTLTNYSVVCLNNQTNLNHTMDQASSNISTTVSPIFNYDQGIKSPFILPLTLPLTVNDNYTFPVMWFDGLDSDRNLTFTGDLLNLTYRGEEEFWPYSWRTALKFSSDDNKHIIRYDKFTKIMIYYESLNDTIPNATQKMVFALVENNADYPSNLYIETRAEVVYEDIYIIPDHLLAIVYDPPGDHSYGQFKSGTTTTVGFQVDTEVVVEEEFQFDLNILGFEVSDYIQDEIGCEDYHNVEVDGKTYETVAEITFQKTLTSSTFSDNASFIGHGGGDLYYGSGLLVHYYVMQYFDYIVIGNESQMTVEESKDPPNQQLDDILVWNGTFWVDYLLNLNSTFSVLGAYLDDYNHQIGNDNYSLSTLLADNIFVDNELLGDELDHVEILPESPVFWTPGTYTEYLSSMTETTSEVRYSVRTEIPESKAFEYGNSLSGGPGGTCVGILGWGVNFDMTTTITTTTLDTTATETNEEILCHLEDDDGMPIGLHDQFLIDIYKDRRFNTFGFIIHENQSYSSSPFENFSRDRRPPLNCLMSQLISKGM